MAPGRPCIRTVARGVRGGASSTSRRLIGLAIGLVLLFEGAPAYADARAKARKYFEEGMRLIEAKHYGPGIEALEHANEIVPHPDVQYNLAMACVDAGRLPEAVQWFEKYLHQPTPPPDAAEIREVVRTLRARIAPPPPEAPPPEAASPAAGGPGEGRNIPEQADRDLKRLEQLAEDLRPLSADRARELGTIAVHVREALRQAEANAAVAPRPEEGAEKPEPSAKEKKAKKKKAKDRAEAGERPEEQQAPAARAGESEPAASSGAGSAASPTGKAAPAIRSAPPEIAMPDAKLRPVGEYDEKEVVSAATRQEARPQDAPAAVWVITQQEIRERGYTSVGEALRAVAGLHIIDDHVFVDAGVRGVHDGLRGESRIIKVLIDGQPVSFHPTSGNFLGPEMIPIRAVDRIELVRGPASALYGANAFLGVLQVVTRKGGDIRGGSVAGYFGLSTSTRDQGGKSVYDPQVSGDFVAGTKQGNLSLILAGQASRLDRSGLALPGTSPYVDELKAMGRGASSNDIASPISLFGSLNYDMHRLGTLTLQSGFQSLDSSAEWLDYGALTHYTRIALQNYWLRLEHDVQLAPDVGLRTFASYTQGGPTARERIRPFPAFSLAPDPSSHLVEDFGSRDVFSGAEANWAIPNLHLGLRAGADLDLDFENLSLARQVFDAAVAGHQFGDSILLPAPSSTTKTFANLGVYLQLSVSATSFLDLIGGLRYDYHNLYGSAINGRVGSVLRLGELVFVKALYGSSFRAPSPDQLYHRSAYIGDTTGCLDYAPCAAVGLQPQQANTVEVVLGVAKGASYLAQVTGFLSFVNDLIISFPNTTNDFVITNAGSYLSKGLEFEASAKRIAMFSGFYVSGHAYLSLEQTTSDIPESLFEPAESIRQEYRQASLFPSISGGAGLDLAYLPAHLGIYVEERYVGARRASGSNLALSLGSSSYEGDSLPAYFVTDANLSTRELSLIGEGETVLSLRVTNVTDTRYAEGGSRGWDIPQLGRMIFFRVIQEY